MKRLRQRFKSKASVIALHLRSFEYKMEKNGNAFRPSGSSQSKGGKVPNNFYFEKWIGKDQRCTASLSYT